MKVKPEGYWSMKYKACRGCGTTDVSHNAKGLCKRCYYQTDEQHETQRKYRNKLKKMAFEAYGNNCACCGEDSEYFLSIDHIDGCGIKRRKLEPSGSPMYAFLKSKGYPSGYQLLCHNCNMAKAHYGKCPHKNN